MKKEKNWIPKFVILLMAVFCLLNIKAIGQQAKSDTNKPNSTENQTIKSKEDEDPPVGSETETNQAPLNPANANMNDFSRMSLREFNLSLIILAFGFVVLLAEFLLLRSVSCNAEQLLRIFGITLIVMGALLMVPAGFSAQAIAPAMGLLGTIAGYLLSQRGNSQREGKE